VGEGSPEAEGSLATVEGGPTTMAPASPHLFNQKQQLKHSVMETRSFWPFLAPINL
jgi:hypothetical protein